jgi:hypothetical protein
VAKRLGVSFEGGEISERSESESTEELERCRVANRSAGRLEASRLFNEPSLKEHAECVVCVDAADLFDATLGDRLAIGDNSECL